MLKCEHCGKEYDETEFDAETFTDEEGLEFDHICEDCASKFLDMQKEGHKISVTSPNNYSEEYHKCWFCEEIFLESELRKEGEGEGDWMCQDCIDACLSRGEHLLLHY